MATADNQSMAVLLEIDEVAPPEMAVPLYGYVFPVLVLLTVITNSFIVLVLWQPHLRTSTNCVLTAMAVAELLTGLASFPWMLYYYTLGGYRRQSSHGMPPFWCRTFPYLTEWLPTMCHTSAIWLTVYLAIQRYWFVSSTHINAAVGSTRAGVGRCKWVIAGICSLAVAVEMPVVFSKSMQPWPVDGRSLCRIRHSEWVLRLGIGYVYGSYYWFMTIFVHAGPCILLVVFCGLLIRTVSRAVRRRRESLGYLLKEKPTFGGGVGVGGGGGGGGGSSRNLHATTKMLVAVVTLFLVTEIPAAVIFTLHVLNVSFKLLPDNSYRTMNIAIMCRNVFILLSYPFNFAVYLSMSQQFRATVRRLFCRCRSDGGGGFSDREFDRSTGADTRNFNLMFPRSRQYNSNPSRPTVSCSPRLAASASASALALAPAKSHNGYRRSMDAYRPLLTPDDNRSLTNSGIGCDQNGRQRTERDRSTLTVSFRTTSIERPAPVESPPPPPPPPQKSRKSLLKFWIKNNANGKNGLAGDQLRTAEPNDASVL